MASPKGHPRYGGRTKGTPNKRSSLEATIFELLGGPRGRAYAEQLHAIATGQHADVHARIKALQIIAPYVWQKRPIAVEHSGPGGGPIPVIQPIDEFHRAHD